MTQLLERKQVPAEHRWQLEDLFADQKAWDQEFQEVKSSLSKVSAFQGKLNDAASVKQIFQLEDELSVKMERLYVYANMKHHEDTAEPTYQALSEKAKKLSVEVGEAASFISPEILSLSDEKLQQLVSDPSLSFYKDTLEEMIRQKPHTLTKEQEALLAQAGTMAGAPSTIFGMLNNADLKFPKVKNEKGEEVELTHGSYIQFLESRDPEVRKNAFKAVYETYRNNREYDWCYTKREHQQKHFLCQSTSLPICS